MSKTSKTASLTAPKKETKTSSSPPTQHVNEPEKDAKAPAKGKTQSKKGKKEVRNPLSLGAGATPEKSDLARKGFATHKSTITDGFNSHKPAADGRAMRRVKAMSSAVRDAKKETRTTVVAGFPSQYELDLVPEYNGLLTVFRDVVHPSDIPRYRKVHKPVIPKGNRVLIVLNDCPMASLEKIYHRFQSFGDGTVHIMASGLTLGGLMGIDIQTGKSPKLSSFWYKEGEVTHTLAVGCISQYPDMVDQPWLDYSISQLTDDIIIQHKPDQLVGLAGYVSHFVLSPGRGTKPVPLGFKLRELGVVIDLSGRVPALISTKWKQFGNSASALTTIQRQARNDLENAYGPMFLEFLETRPDHKLAFERARDETLNYCQAMPTIPVQINSVNTASEASYQARVSRYSDLPGGKVLAAISEKATLPDMIARLYRLLVEAAKKLYATFLAWRDRVRQSADDDSVDPSEWSTTSEETEEGFVLQPNNILFSFQAALHRVAKLCSKSSHSGVMKAGQGLHRVANVLQKPFPSLSDIDDDDIFKLLLKLLAVMGATLIERALALMFGDISAFVVGLVEFLLLVAASDSPAGAALSCLVSALGHLLLAIMPWWLSIPLHLIYDIAATGCFEKVVEMFRKFGFKGVAQKLWKDMQLFFRNIRRAIDSHVTPDLEIIEDEYHLVEPDLQTTTPDMRDVGDMPDVSELEITLNGLPFQKESFEVLLTSCKDRSKERVLPLLSNVPTLNNVTKTGNDPITLMSALGLRFNNIVPAPPCVSTYAREAAIKLIEIAEPVRKEYRPFTEEEFRQHMADKNWSKTKVRQYDMVIRKHNRGETYDPKKMPMGPKGNEMLKTIEGDGVKARLVHNVSPAEHYPHILESLGIKRFLKDLVPTLELKGEKWKLTFYRPEKGTTSEMAARMGPCAPGEIRWCYSGDDSKVIFRTKKGYWAVSADLKAADTTIQSALQKEVHRFLSWVGLSDASIESNMRMNTGMKEAKFYTDQGVQKITLDLKTMMNSSGTSLTTVITDVTMLLLAVQTFLHWDQDINTFVPSMVSASNRLGLRLELEVYPDTTSNQLTKLGVNSFLSMILTKTRDGRLVAFKRSYTKTMLTRGPTQADGGLTVSFAVANRANDPSLDRTPLGQAMKRALRRHVAQHPVPKIGVSDPTDQYKIQSDDDEALTADDEMDYLERLVPGFTPQMYQDELATWDSIEEFPAWIPPGGLPIYCEMARQHYGYKDDLTSRALPYWSRLSDAEEEESDPDSTDAVT